MRRIVSRRHLLSLTLGLVGLFGGTSSGKADEFETADVLDAPIVAAADETVVEETPVNRCVDITGCWNCGGWRSSCTSHHGKLRATIVRCDACHYKCTFSGTFFGVIPFRYTATLTVTGYGDGVVYFRSSRNLPLFGGQFSMCGQATACSFTAWYTSPKDKGIFTLSR